MPPDVKDDIEAAERLVRIEASVEATRVEVSTLRTDLARYFSELVDHEGRIRVVEKTTTAHHEKLRYISKQTNAWNLGNSIGAGIATAIAWFK